MLTDPDTVTSAELTPRKAVAVARGRLWTVRERHDRDRATALTILDHHFAVPFPRQLARDREAEAAARWPASPRAASMKALEHDLALAGGETGTAIAYLNSPREG